MYTYKEANMEVPTIVKKISDIHRFPILNKDIEINDVIIALYKSKEKSLDLYNIKIAYNAYEYYIPVIIKNDSTREVRLSQLAEAINYHTEEAKRIFADK